MVSQSVHDTSRTGLNINIIFCSEMSN